MCRHFCYLGEPVALSDLLLRPPHSLVVQSYAPQDMRGAGTVNADGFGVGWFDGSPQAARYRRAIPIWQDSALPELAGRTVATAVLAAVRNATVGMPVIETAAAPFTDGRWLFSLNGRIDGWPDTAVELAEGLPRREVLTMEAPTDAALLWLLLRHRLAAEGADPATVLGDLVAEVLATAPDSRLNLLLTDGQRAYASTHTHSLWFDSGPESVLIASEPFDDSPGWQQISDGQLVTARVGAVDVRPLPPAAPRPG
ncbi:MAG: ergothioneine biosynthesis protein EgtC [Actinomycetota bacterium]|nr:ergothioneine biosynthesis protein EgtC [Actinomycetota bacterium]MDQ2957222.1 ergothioneine biosynthesis protein EgtC [Actinomycetota bacterium]